MCTLRYTGMEVRFRPQSGKKNKIYLLQQLCLLGLSGLPGMEFFAHAGCGLNPTLPCNV